MSEFFPWCFLLLSNHSLALRCVKSVVGFCHDTTVLPASTLCVKSFLTFIRHDTTPFYLYIMCLKSSFSFLLDVTVVADWVLETNYISIYPWCLVLLTWFAVALPERRWSRDDGCSGVFFPSVDFVLFCFWRKSNEQRNFFPG